MLREELGIDAELQAGSGGIFEVRVGDRVVAKKTLTGGFPGPERVLAAVRDALPDAGVSS